MWIVTIFSHLISITGYNVLLRHVAAARKVDPLFLATITSTAIALPAAIGIILVKIDWSRFNPHTILFFILSIAVATSFHIIIIKALEKTEASVFSFLYNFRIGFVTILSILLLGESLSPINLAGSVFIFVAGVILLGKSTTSLSGVMFSVLTAILISILNILDKYLISEIGFAAYIFTSSFICTGILWIILLVMKRPISMSVVTNKEFVVLMVFRCISVYGFTLSLALGALVSISSYISALSCITTPIAAMIFLKETNSVLKKIIAGIIALIGLTLIFI